MDKRLTLSTGINFTVDHNDVWWIDAPAAGLTVMLSIDMQDQDILFDQNDGQLVLSGTSTFAIFTPSTLETAYKLKGLTKSNMTVEPEIQK